MLRRIFPCSLLALTCIASSLPHTAEAAPQVSPKALAKAGVKTIKCPFVGFLNTGLYSRIGGNELCGLGFAKLKKPKPSKGKFPLSSSVVQGTAFESIDSAQGPMVTELFKVGNYPGLITYEVSGTKGSFKLELVDAKGKRVENLLDVPLGSSGTAAINTPGLFALKITPAPASKGEAPTYSLSMGF
ncbi:MAG: hypothetical protein EBZ48_15970, partial [Proteobacteria bacterium]|nr:hypothetical protein [Pseudomonadota bacterium]